MTDQWTILKGNPPDPYVDVLIKFPSNMAVGFIDRDDIWSVYSGGGWYTEVAENDEQPIAWKALNEESMDEQEKRNEPIKPEMIMTTNLGVPILRCSNCKNDIHQYWHPKFCGYCGQAVKWE